MEMQCIDKEGNEIIIGDTNGDSIAKRQSWREDDCSTCATDSDFNLDELFLMNPGTLFIFYPRKKMPELSDKSNDDFMRRKNLLSFCGKV